MINNFVLLSLSFLQSITHSLTSQKWKIQDKIDGWNVRMQQGKKDFDQWEKENEVGRKILAGLRTVWLVEENSLKKVSRSSRNRKSRNGIVSKYRLVNYANDVLFFSRKILGALWSSITRSPGEGEEWSEIVRGVKASFSDLNFEILSQRLGSGLAALVCLNLIGTLYSSVPSLLSLFAISSGILFPNWIAFVVVRIEEELSKFAARGRGEKIEIKKDVTPKQKFYFYKTKEGRKRWYRAGDSMFKKINEEKANSFKLPWVNG